MSKEGQRQYTLQTSKAGADEREKAAVVRKRKQTQEKKERVPTGQTILLQSRDPVTESRGMRGLSPEQTTLLQCRDPDTDNREM